MRRHPLTAFLVVSSLLVAREASANPDITGYSGKPYNGAPGETCSTNCHRNGGAGPTLTFTTPASVEAGSTHEITVVIAGNKTRTAMNVAFSDGVKALKGMNTASNDPTTEPSELRAVNPPPGGASSTYKFSFVAPNKNGPFTMWLTGMAASGSGTANDGVASTTRTITVTGATAVDAGVDAGPTTDAGGGDGGGGGTGDGGGGGTGDGGGSSGSSGSSGSTSGGTSGSTSSGGDLTDDSGGCAAAPGPGGTTTGGAGAWLLGLSVLGYSRRRARRGAR